MSTPQIPSTPPSVPPRATWLETLQAPGALISSLKWGALVGLVYYLIGVGLKLILNGATNVDTSTTLDAPLVLGACSSVFVAVFALYVAGFLPSAETRTVAPGVVGAFIMLVVSKALSYLPIGRSSTTGASGTIIVQLVSFALFLGVAFGIAYLGAFYGVKRTVKAEAKKR